MGVLRLWEVPAPLEGNGERITCWTEIITGMELDVEGMVHVLDAGIWHERRPHWTNWEVRPLRGPAPIKKGLVSNGGMSCQRLDRR